MKRKNPAFRYIDVAVPLPIFGRLTYALNEKTPLPRPGTRVIVPVGGRDMVAVVWGEKQKPEPSLRIREVREQLDREPLLSGFMLSFLEWVSSYYFYPLGQVLEEALPPGFLSSRSRKIASIREKSQAKAQCRLEIGQWQNERPSKLTSEQQNAIEHITNTVSEKRFQTILLHGVTGSGKTEVYLRATGECLDAGKKALILVPEIAMTTQAVGRFVDRFGSEVTVLHSRLTQAQRMNQWQKVRAGESSIVVGTRSAVFAPVSGLGLIVVDEEHDPSYKQSSRLRYQARDLAVMLGRMSEAAVVLGSATPSVSSYQNALSGKYQLLSMTRRVAERPLPMVELIDRRKNSRAQRTGLDISRQEQQNIEDAEWLGPELYLAMRETLGRGEQVLLFLNRRGFATYVFCTECGHVFRCPHCEVTLTWHRDSGQAGKAGEVLMCHYCGLESPALPACPKCNGLAVKASGYGTERVFSDLARVFPGAETARLDRDTVQSRKRMETILKKFHAGKIDILVGTQMVTKGHDFPGLTLVGILWADLGINVPEYHAGERTFQLICQVAGRAGRSELPGKVLVQTWMPDHYALAAARSHDYSAFFRQESGFRKALGYPPFGRLINLLFSGKNREKVSLAAERAADYAKKTSAGQKRPDGTGVEVMGPAPAPMEKLKGRYRWQVLLKSASLSDLRQAGAAVV
ncbi:MAG TPA: primosomal protein N', partial [Thermodesulfobacteriaceae bacterium]|nr:primosomal protein N' [Thermodesulfobacteriaceae bacterium]